MAIDALVSIGAYDFPEPSTYTCTVSDVVDSGRNVDGVVVGDVVRSDVAKIELTWNYISAADWAAVLQKFAPAYGGSFFNSVTFFNQVKNGWDTRTMYVNDRKAPVWLRDSLGAIRGYNGASLNLIEV